LICARIEVYQKSRVQFRLYDTATCSTIAEYSKSVVSREARGLQRKRKKQGTGDTHLTAISKQIDTIEEFLGLPRSNVKTLYGVEQSLRVAIPIMKRKFGK